MLYHKDIFIIFVCIYKLFLFRSFHAASCTPHGKVDRCQQGSKLQLYYLFTIYQLVVYFNIRQLYRTLTIIFKGSSSYMTCQIRPNLKYKPHVIVQSFAGLAPYRSWIVL